jgi:hydroxyacylglutathione hydrolase
MNLLRFALSVLWLFLGSTPAGAALTPGSMDVQWDGGAKSGQTRLHAPIQVHAYNPQTFILRENLGDTWEAPFIYLLVGSRRALLIDTGDVADPKVMPLEKTVMALLPGDGLSKLPLIVAHSHGHLDHRQGDAQFENHPGVQLVPSDLAQVRTHFGFSDWPNGTAEVDLGDRVVDVLPAPGHHPAHVVYYDRSTGILFSGDFLLPGRLLVDDTGAYRASARRVADFVRDRPVSHVLGGHIEKNAAGGLFPWQSTFHPDEHALPLTKADVLSLPASLQTFNGFYSETGHFVIEHPIHNLAAFAGAVILFLAGAGILTYRFVRRRRGRSV